MKRIHSMMRIVGSLVTFLMLHAIAEPAPAVKPFAFKYDFEDGRTLDIKPLVANGKFTVNFMGITAEKAFIAAKT